MLRRNLLALTLAPAVGSEGASSPKLGSHHPQRAQKHRHAVLTPFGRCRNPLPLHNILNVEALLVSQGT